MKRSKNEITKRIDAKIEYLRNMIKECEKFELNSYTREEYALNISNALRVLLHSKGRSLSLFKQHGVEEYILFPLYRNGLDGKTLYTCFSLTEFKVNKSQRKVYFKSAEFISNRVLYRTYIPFLIWWNEIVVDIKRSGFLPLSRKQIVLIMAENEGGSHLDPNWNRYALEAASNDISDRIIEDPIGRYKFVCDNIFVENVISIAKEIVFYFDFTRYLKIAPLVKQDYVAKLFFCKNNKSMKVMISNKEEEKSLLYGTCFHEWHISDVKYTQYSLSHIPSESITIIDGLEIINKFYDEC